MPTTSTTPTLDTLAAEQKAWPILAFSLGDEARFLHRLRATHAKKLGQLNACEDLLAETAPDLILRAADGRKVVLRLPSDGISQLCGLLREVLAQELRKLEKEIISELRQQAASAPSPANDSRPAILALCQPTPLPATAPAVGVVALASQRPDSLPTAA